jgi:hypothetical protein
MQNSTGGAEGGWTCRASKVMKISTALMLAIVATPALANDFSVPWSHWVAPCNSCAAPARGWPKDLETFGRAEQDPCARYPTLRRCSSQWHAPPLPQTGRSLVKLEAIYSMTPQAWYLPASKNVVSGIEDLLSNVKFNKAGWFDPHGLTLDPPAQYDHPYKGDLTIIRTAMQHVQEMCPPFQPGVPPVACATNDIPHTWCRIVLAHDDELKAIDWDPQQILRHEMAHCNGWPADHPGARHLQ